MEEMLNSVLDFLKMLFSEIIGWIVVSALWAVNKMRDFLLDTGIVDNVTTATVIPIILLAVIFLILIGWFIGPRRVFGQYNNDRN
ncbi:hypothetical protein [Oceanobacillus massiliensis]|uniref:hypothetical protein n=1 Tax=Oceanobacillus massiliensis TaxID=1465765 RepID=UPI0002892AD1|nr:hypothetical protein [Oceanobacillus massiliensis]